LLGGGGDGGHAEVRSHIWSGVQWVPGEGMVLAQRTAEDGRAEG
jgi:hypothetical protein